MMATGMVKLIEDWFAAWNSYDPERICRFYTDDCVFEHVALAAVYHGRNELTAYIKRMVFDYPDLKIEQQASFFSKNWVFGEVIMSGTQVHSSDPAIQPTGKTFSVRGAYTSEWQKGKVRRHSYYADQLTVMRQLGLINQPATETDLLARYAGNSPRVSMMWTGPYGAAGGGTGKIIRGNTPAPQPHITMT